MVLQTFAPEHYVIQAAAQHDVKGFYQHELDQRKRLGYPPFSRLVRLEFRHADPVKAEEEAKKYPDITVLGAFYSKESPQDAAAKIEEVQTAHPEIDGWAMIGSWSLFTDALLKWEPGKVKIVAMDALPAELPYLRKGIVARLYAQQTYQWGYRSVEILADKVILGKDPPEAIEYSPLLPVDKKNVEEFEQNWKKWLRQ